MSVWEERVNEAGSTCRIGKEHHETVDADAPATSWRKAMFKTGAIPFEHYVHESWGKLHSRIDKGLIDVLCFIVTLCLLSQLLLEACPLLKGVI
jgi:hypothetical protein